jgi:hypothetical protein
MTDSFRRRRSRSSRWAGGSSTNGGSTLLFTQTHLGAPTSADCHARGPTSAQTPIGVRSRCQLRSSTASSAARGSDRVPRKDRAGSASPSRRPR